MPPASITTRFSAGRRWITLASTVTAMVSGAPEPICT